MSVNTPILFLIFNRPETTQRVFARIKAVKPKQLFIVADGPRLNNGYDIERCEQTRNGVLKDIDWDCEVKTQFRTQNLGCGKSVSEGISWFFEQVDEGIILEDDTLPDLSFFSFCEQLLEKYRFTNDIMSIAGTNLMADKLPTSTNGYLFSSYGGIWGWASWRRAWKLYDYNIEAWRSKKTHFQFVQRYGYSQYLFFKSIFDNFVNGKKIDTWDYQWWFCKLNNAGLTVIPSVNLIKNVGFGTGATHMVGVVNPALDVPVGTLYFPLQHPTQIVTDKLYEYSIIIKFYSVKYNYWQKIKLLRKLFLN